MVTLIVSIQVENFDKWRQAYDAAEEFRSKLGIVMKGIYQSVEDQNKVTLISDYPSLEMAKNILANPQWEENQRKGGVIGGFNISFCEKIA
ncbi:MAG: cyclase [Crocinitomicaceae bacterium]|jgi:hypothetical protein|nr:cyclase [Crocinitomicaceae bacterium]